MSMPKVSVIIPVYKVEKYLRRCIDSVIGQSLTDIEIILVDDGSGDTCPAICDEYAEKDKRITVIHKKNGGLSSARNAGLEKCRGEYVFFLDSDDWIDLDGLERLVSVADEQGVSLLRFRPFRSFWPNLPDDAPCLYGDDRELRDGYYSEEDVKNEVIPRLLATSSLSLGPILSACTGLYRKELLTDNGISFDEDVKYSEDIIFSARTVLAAGSFYYVGEAGVYHYFYNPDSISKSIRTDRIDAARRLVSVCNERFRGVSGGIFDRQIDLLRWNCILNCLSDRRFISDRKERRKFIKTILSDPLVKDTRLVTRGLRVSFRTRCLMLCVKLGLSSVIARN